MKIYQNGKESAEFEQYIGHDRSTNGYFQRLIGINIDWISRVPTILPVYAPLFYVEQHPGQFIIIWQGWSPHNGYIIHLEVRWPFIHVYKSTSVSLEKTDDESNL